MAVFYNDHSGAYHTASQSLNPAAEADFLAYEALLHTGIGWHEYTSVTQMNAAVAAHPGWPRPTSSLAKATGQAAGQAASAAGKLTGMAAIGDFFQRLGQASTWVRVGEVILGFALIIVGLAKLAEGTPLGHAALKAGKAAALL
jgi:hypothetical protein